MLWSRVIGSVCLLGVSLFWAAGCSGLRVFFPSKTYETTAPEVPETLSKPAVLLFSKTNGFRHEEAIPAANALLTRLAEQRGWGVFATENGAIFNAEDLSRFKVVVWNNTSGDTLNAEQKKDWQTWLQAGGGAVAIHGAGGDPSYDWDWHPESFIRAQFTMHTMGPQFQDATAVVENPNHPATRNLPASWTHEEEWYSFEESPRGKDVDVLVRVDEATYDPTFSLFWMDSDIAMGDHPVVWSHCEGRGRVFYSALGHQAAAYETPEMMALLGGALDWAAHPDLADCHGRAVR